MPRQDCIIIYFNPEADEAALAMVQGVLEELPDDVIDIMDYSVQAYPDGFGRLVSRQDTVRSY